jgi:hypothetical protein
MFPNLKKIYVCFVLLAAAATVSAQTNFAHLDREISKVLLKKDLRQAIRESEAASGKDLQALLWRLSLYRRAAHGEKIALTVRQILGVSDPEKNGYEVKEPLRDALKDPLFNEIETLQLYVQFSFDSDIYGRLVELCSQNRQTCDIHSFDKWLARRAEENTETKSGTAYYYGGTPYWDWVSRRLSWRKKVGLDNTEILNQFVEEVRKNPSDLDVAVRYLRFADGVQDMEWLAQTFTSEQAYDHFELGETLSTGQIFWPAVGNEARQGREIGLRFLQRSLSLPFNKRDIDLMYSRRFRFASIQPVIKNHEKQLRFWTKTTLAEAYKNIGEPQKAQPIVEELMNTDTSDIVSEKPSQLAGMVQAGSGARAVESKILREQAARQDSYEYWWERVAYYQGRKEAERVFDAYRQGLSAVPFELSNERSREGRLFFIRRFADFSTDGLRYYADWKDSSEQLKQSLFRVTEDLLRDEFEKTKTNVRYAYELSEIIADNEFKKLSAEIVSGNPDLLVNAAKIDLINDLGRSPNVFFELETVPRAKKDLIFQQLLKISENKNARSAWSLCEALLGLDEDPAYAARVIPILVRNLKIAAGTAGLLKGSEDDYSEVKSLEEKYIEILFTAHLAANDWRSAEKLLIEKHRAPYSSSFDRLISSAAKSGAFDDAVRLWKMKANLNRRDLENLSFLAQNPKVAAGLREFYKRMKIDEPYSPVPDIALQTLK